MNRLWEGISACTFGIYIRNADRITEKREGKREIRDEEKQIKKKT